MDYSLPGSSVHGIIRQVYRSGLPCPPPGDPPDPGIEPLSPAFQEDSSHTEPPPSPFRRRHFRSVEESQHLSILYTSEVILYVSIWN